MASPPTNTLSCCRYHDGNPLVLNACDNEAVRIQASTLEKALTKRLMLADEDCEEVVFSIRYDAHWLRCQPPKHSPVGTILGIAEDEGDEHLELELALYRPQEATQQSTTTHCSCQAPHSDWKRRALKTQDEAKTRSKLALAWMDVRNQTAPLLTSQGGVLHFLRSILSSSHAVSPWVHEEDNGFPTADIVVLVVDEPLPILQAFRVSDASPSWFLHATAQCEELESNQFWNPYIDASSPPGTLYIYKRLTPRPWLTSNHPAETSATSTVGFLWETVPPSSKEDGEKPNLSSIPKEPTFRLQCPPYVHLLEEYPESCRSLFDPETLRVFTEEASRIPQWTPWPETHHYSASSDGNTKPWTVFPLCYCFPSNQPENLAWVEATKTCCPRTCQLLQEILGGTLRTALFSQLAPHSTLEAHTGWADLANHVLRLHIPLVIPPGGLCGTWVDGCVETHANARPLLFDDSKIHRAFNYSDETRIVLIVDLERQAHLPIGLATGGHSDELDAFIQQISKPR